MAEPATPYAFDRLHSEASALLAATRLVPAELITLTEPKSRAGADLVFPVFTAAQATKSEPGEFAKRLADAIILPQNSLIARVEAVGGFLNFHLHPEIFAVSVLDNVFERGQYYGNSISIGKGKPVAIDFSSPNLARSPGIDILRYTAMGQSLSLLLKALGYTSVSCNVYGDNGTDIALHRAEFDLLYKRLGVSFAVSFDESYFEEMANDVVNEAVEKGVAHVELGGAVVVDFGSGVGDLPTCLLRKTNGESLYLTRTLARIIHRARAYHFERSIYVIAAEQKLHFQQVLEIARRMGYSSVVDNSTCIPVEPIVEIQSVKVAGGTYRWQPVKIPLQRQTSPNALLDTAIALEKGLVNRRSHFPPGTVGIGAIRYVSLCVGPEQQAQVRSYDGSWRFFEFSYNYIQAASYRTESLVDRRWLIYTAEDGNLLTAPEEQAALKQLARMPLAVRTAGEKLRPTIIARWTYDLARASGYLYSSYFRPVAETRTTITSLEIKARKMARLQLMAAVAQGLKNGMALLGVTTAEFR